MRHSWLLLILAGAAALSLAPGAHADEPPRVEVRLERMVKGDWEQVEPNRVLESGDKVRFRFRSSFDGFLYVMNHGSGGQHEMLFPNEQLKRSNRVRAGQDYEIPGGSAWFKVEGPPGYEVTLWLVTPSRMGNKIDPGAFGKWPVEPGRVAPEGDLRPRCDDWHLKTSGVCVDPKAGPRAVRRTDELPRELGEIGDLSARDLRIENEGTSATIYPKANLDAPVLYEFRLAHK